MQQLDHDHLVDLKDVVRTQNNAYIIQEYCDQGDLEKQLQKHKTLSETDCVPILVDILQGYMEILKANIIHRDLKLANIFIKEGKYKLGPFFS